MNHCKALLLAAFVGLTVNAQSVNVRGKVSNQAGKPLSNAVVALLGQGARDTTGADGAFAITTSGVAVVTAAPPPKETILFNKGVLEFSLTNPSAVKVDVFDVNGHLLGRELLSNAGIGVYRMDLWKSSLATTLLVVNASIGQRTVTFRYFPLRNGTYTMNSSLQSAAQAGGRLAKISAVTDTLKTTANGYTTKVVAITSYDTTVNITLDTASGTLTAGCGKTPPVSGVKTSMDVGGTKREYLLKLPANYDPDKSYKLIFCPHWMGGKIEDVVSGGACGGPYYGLEKLANGTAIFVLPQGLSSGGSTVFPNTNGQDIKFFKALLKLCDSTMCIDHKHIFSVGFSYGGMMSLAAGCGMPDVFRAIAPMSGAFYSGCDSTSKGPVAVWQAHGTSDNVVPIANAKTALKYYLALNGCSDQTKPVDPSPCAQYQGCKDGYPVTFCEFSGGHGVQSFAAAAIWSFFSQF